METSKDICGVVSATAGCSYKAQIRFNTDDLFVKELYEAHFKSKAEDGDASKLGKVTVSGGVTHVTAYSSELPEPRFVCNKLKCCAEVKTESVVFGTNRKNHKFIVYSDERRASALAYEREVFVGFDERLGAAFDPSREWQF